MSIYKNHIIKAEIDLNNKAGRTRDEILAAYGLEDFHKMSSNENALGPSPMAMDAVKRCVNELHEYSNRTDEKLRLALASQFGDRLKEDQFITTNSGLELLELTVQGFVDVDDEVIISNPTFHVYEIFAKIAGARVVDVPLDTETFDVRVDEILNAITDRTKLLFITNPNNPCGVGINKADMDRLVNGVPDHVVILIDEVYHHFHDMAPFAYAEDYILQGKNVIGLHSFSKAYGLAGIRLAYGFSTSEISEYLQKLRRPFFINTMTMEAGLAALTDEEHIRNTQKLVKEGRDYLYGEFQRLGLRYWPSHTNFILVKPEMDHLQLIENMMKRGISLRAGDNNGAMGCVRITIGTMEANRALIQALEKELS